MVWGAAVLGMTGLMITRRSRPRWLVRLSVARRGGWRAWGAVSGDFDRALTAQASGKVSAPHIDAETRRGHDYVRVTMGMTIAAGDVAEALATAWWAFRQAARDDARGWDMASATADVRPAEDRPRAVKNT